MKSRGRGGGGEGKSDMTNKRILCVFAAFISIVAAQVFGQFPAAEPAANQPQPDAAPTSPGVPSVVAPTSAVVPLPATQEPPAPVSAAPAPLTSLPAEELLPRGVPAPGPNVAMLRLGEDSFRRNCTECHDAAKSLETAKSFPDWLATVRRMADKPDASIPKNELEPIAAYLANQNPAPVGAVGVPSSFPALMQSVRINGTLSPTFRGGSDQLQNGGFFPDVWLGVNVNNGGPLTGRATACVSCHDDGGSGSRIELVDAALRMDVLQALGWQHPNVKVAGEFGRFIVPFGAFASQSNPGVYRTVTRPLMFNMGMRVRDADLGDPVLPMPYSDEGASMSFAAPVGRFMNFGFDGYVINGLQGTADGIDFDMSRAYTATNTRPSIGGRATLGNDYFKLGASALGGTFTGSSGAGPNNSQLNYRVFGVDASFRYQDLIRFQAEYARRDNDHLRGDPLDPTNTRDVVDGCYAETEILLLDYMHTSFLFRYDRQRQSARIPGGTGISFDPFNVQRLTYGLNFTLPGGSLLMVNYEYWMLPAGFENINVYGLRWAATF